LVRVLLNSTCPLLFPFPFYLHTSALGFSSMSAVHFSVVCGWSLEFICGGRRALLESVRLWTAHPVESIRRRRIESSRIGSCVGERACILAYRIAGLHQVLGVRAARGLHWRLAYLLHHTCSLIRRVGPGRVLCALSPARDIPDVALVPEVFSCTKARFITPPAHRVCLLLWARFVPELGACLL
jgi:hypothetical protein